MLVIDHARRTRRLRAIRTLIPITSLLFSFAPAFAQVPATRPEFEVASVKRIFQGAAHGWYRRWEDDLRQPMGSSST
jgi:hypothetical protein